MVNMTIFQCSLDFSFVWTRGSLRCIPYTAIGIQLSDFMDIENDLQKEHYIYDYINQSDPQAVVMSGIYERFMAFRLYI